jgi:preprotein translocase subunit SecD
VPRVFLALLCFSLVLTGCDGSDAAGTPRFAIFLVDENINSENAPPDTERLPASPESVGLPVAFWLRREGGMSGPFVADARVIAAPDGQPAVEFTLTPDGRDRFAALTRTNIGRRVAVVVNGAVVASSVIGAEMTDGRAMLSGNYTEAQARLLADELIATATP